MVLVASICVKLLIKKYIISLTLKKKQKKTHLASKRGHSLSIFSAFPSKPSLKSIFVCLLCLVKKQSLSIWHDGKKIYAEAYIVIDTFVMFFVSLVKTLPLDSSHSSFFSLTIIDKRTRYIMYKCIVSKMICVISNKTYVVMYRYILCVYAYN